MKEKLKCVGISQAQNGSHVVFQNEPKDKKQTRRVVIQFQDAKEAAKFVHGQEYNVSIEPVK